MTAIKRQFLFIVICFFNIASVAGQALCEPFYVIGQSNKGKVWQAIFQGCVDFQYPIIKSDENPLIRAQVISKLKIRKITSKESSDSIAKTEYFDKNGYTVFVGKDTANGLYCYNVFNKYNVLLSVVCKKGYSINGIKKERSGVYHVVEKFIYDDLNRLVKKRK